MADGRNPLGLWDGFEEQSAWAAREEAAHGVRRRRRFHVEVTLASSRSPRRLRVEIAPLLDSRDAVTGWMGMAVDITQVQQERAELEERLREVQQLVDGVAGVFWVTSADHRTTFLLTAGFERIFGETPASLPSPADWDRVIVDEDVTSFRATLGSLSSGEVARATAAFRIRRAGMVRHVEAHFTVLPDGSGKPRRVVGCASDVTHHREVEEALRSGEERFRELAELSNDVFFSVTPDFSRLLDSHRGHGRISGTDVASVEANPLRWLQSVVPEDRPRMQEAIRQISQGAVERAEQECRLYRESDGELRTVLARAFLVRSPDGRPRKITGVLTDVTDRRRIEEALRISEERYHLAALGSTDGLYDWDIARNQVYYSPRWKEMLGHAESEIGTHFEEWRSRLHPNDHDWALSYVNDFLAGRIQEFKLEARLRHKDGTYRWILSRAALLRDAQGRPQRLVGSHVDLTTQRELQRRVLEVSERERRIIGYDLHDGIGQQLTAVEMLVQSLIRRVPSTDDLSHRVMGEISQLVRQSIAHVRSVSRGLAPTTPGGKGLADALEELAHVSQQASGIRCQFHPGPTLSKLDPLVATQLYRITQEAVNNAVKHSRAGRIDIFLRQVGSNLSLAVEDNGRGLPEPNGRGNGHGMEIMQYRAHLLGAHLEIVPRADGGTAVRCRLLLLP